MQYCFIMEIKEHVLKYHYTFSFMGLSFVILKVATIRVTRVTRVPRLSLLT